MEEPVVEALQGYLLKLLPIVLECQERDIKHFKLLDKETILIPFATDPSSRLLFFSKTIQGEAEAEGVLEEPQISFIASNSVVFHPNYESSAILIKLVAHLEEAIPMAQQCILMNIPKGSPYEIIHAYIHNAAYPLFDAYVDTIDKNNTTNSSSLIKKQGDGKMGIPVTRKKFAELELSLMNLQQNVEIPQVILVHHQDVLDAIEKGRRDNAASKPSVEDFAEKASDSSFLNRLQAGVNSWIKEIQKVTKLNRDPSSISASQEINFWISMEKSLSAIETQLKSEEVVLTLEILKSAKRFHTTVSFIADTGLKESLDQVSKYNILMKEFPLNDLLSAPEMEKVKESLLAIFNHLNKKMKLSPYPVKRALVFVEAISNDFLNQLIKVLGTRRLMSLEYEEFEKINQSCQEAFLIWEDQIKEFTAVCRDVTRKRGEKIILLKINNAHEKLVERLSFISKFRNQHEQLLHTIINVTKQRANGGFRNASGFTDSSAVEEIKAAYEVVKSVDVLDVSTAGTEEWIQVESTYNDRISKVEGQIISVLRNNLATCKNANEMFRVFSTFNSLFVRPKIRGAVQEYQTELMENVKKDIFVLQEKFKKQYRNSEAFVLNQMRDIPPVAGAIMWAKQIENQLNTYMRRVEDVLGKGWELYSEGAKLLNESMTFRRKLETKPIYDSWLQEVSSKNLTIGGRVFAVTRGNGHGGTTSQICVNFDGQLVTLFKEVRNLIWLGFPIPHNIITCSKDGKRIYPFAISLTESIRYFNATTLVIKANPFILPLVETYRDKIQTLIRKGMTISWDMLSSAYDNRSYGAVVNESENPCVAFVKDLSLMAGTYHQKTVFVVSVNDEIGKLLQSLKSANYKEEVLKEIMDSLQKKVDSLSLESCSNLGSWVGNLNDRIGEILLSRLEDACKIWLKKFNLIVEEGSNDTNEESLEIRSFTHEIVISNQTLQVVPHVEKSREHWIKELHSWLGIACFLPKLNAERFDLGYEKSDLQNFKYLLSKLNKDSLVPIYESINVRISQMASYADDWLQHQALWDLNPGQVFEFLGKDLKKWQTLLAEIKKARGMTFDNSSDRKDFGHSSVLYGKVQGKVMAKYDAIQREIILHFGALMMDVMRSFHEELTNTRTQLESQSLDSESTSSAVSLVTFVQTVKKRILEWEEEIEVFVTGQKLLEKHRYSFPKDWMYVENIVGEWSAFQEIFQRKSLLIQDKLSIIQAKVITEDQALDAKAKQSLQEWEKSKPVQGSLKAVAVLSSLSAFETRFSRLQDDKIKVDKAKMALEMDVSPGNEFLKAVLEEIQDFKTVWNCLAKVWQMLDELREISWFSCSPRKIRQQLEQCSSELKEMPTRVRQYAAFEYVNDTVKNYIKYHSILSDLKSGSIKDRHWKHISKHLYNDAASLIPVEMNVGNVWDLDMKKNENFLKDVLSTAQGENALEEYLSQVKDHWQAFSLDLVNYQNKCRLVKGWDDVFTKCHEHIASLRSMKHSPYYKIFEEEALGWEEKLNRVFSLFDIWIDVQRQWVYLEGIFNESTDIRHLLPMETARFSGINSEYFAVLKKVYKSVVILDIIAIPNIQKSMERLQEMLLKIQKALGEYLEKERASFPRFYFVGDEDLLEIVGNSKDITKLQKHLRKMFAGIHGVILSDDSTAITGLFCSEGENIALTKPIVFKNYSKMNEWLTALELAMRLSLESLLGIAVREIDGVLGSSSFDESFLFSWIEKTPDQIILLSLQVAITSSVESKLQNLDELISAIDVILESLSSKVVVSNIDPLLRKKCEHLITELVYQRDVCRDLVRKAVSSCTDFEWLRRMRFYYKSDEREPLKRLSVKMANASFLYGFEYLGVPERLVKTPLTERCYLTLTQALESRLGGSPFGQAGTGKTESVKSLGLQLGRFVLVFCCDENFDFQAMGRIFIGLCKVGTFGCFDEFNRLEERILSAVSQQIQTIQLCLKNSLFDGSKNEIELVGKIVNVHPETGIFITMNPTYAGRSNLPENLKKLFRSIAMTKPDRQLIAQVMLFSQGFRHAESLARKMSPFFKLCEDQLSQQSHYDFGLRALKSCLISAGNLKRNQSQASTSYEDEQIILIQSIYETVLPKLTAEDIPLLRSLVSDFFEGVQYSGSSVGVLKETIEVLCREKGYIESEAWIQKVIQLYQIQCIHHGIMLVGSSASGKSSSWRILVEAIERIEKMESAVYVINPKAVSKESLYGHLDNTTREWNDGLFTHILRKVVDNVRGEKEKRHWIVFDGDIDPAWVENLNSVLDDNKLLTLPNGERLSLPDNVRVLFEVENVKYATMATVSRCGMILFGSDVVDCTMILKHWFQKYQKTPFDEYEIDSNAAYSWQKECLSVLEPFFFPDQSTGSNIILKALDKSASLFHVMEFSRIRLIETFFAMMKKSIKNVINYNLQHSDFPLPKEIIQRYLFKRLVFSLIWSFSGDSKGSDQHTFSDFVKDLASTITVGTIDFSRIAAGQSLNDFDVSLQDGEWVLWKSKVPVVEVDTQKVAEVDVVIPTVDTVRNEELIYTLLAEHMPVILCGPPGSGKTMSLFSALRKLPDTEVLGVNFSSGTSFEFLISTFSQHCEYRKTPDGVILSPRSIGKWLVIFCDEINLPAYDNYGTQKVISFIRQLVEQNGFWKNKQWIQLERIQFVGACNPPTDPGRKPLSPRFLRHAPILYVDYPGPTALKQIYGTFIKSLLKITPNLRMYDEALTSAMIEFYLESQKKFTPDMEAHYVYSPRELTRWMRGIFESLRNIDTVSWENLIRIWAHEGLRLFYDRLTKEDERRWTDALIDSVAIKYFGKFDKKAALERPILFSNWLSKNYVSVDREVLREFVKARLRVFYEEELDVQLVLFDDVLDHVLRIDRVFRQWQGHLLLIGVSGAGKTTLSRFVAWMNGLSIFQVKAHKNYTIEDFDEDLKLVLKRCSYKGEKICFIIDEGNVLEPAFLERINTLLANAEIPGLFKEDEMAALMNSCKESAQKEGIMIDSLDETYRWFTLQIMKNLHVVFTMNPPKGGLQDRTATSPALFNRCVLDWFGDWSIKALYQVVSELTRGLDLDASAFVAPKTLPEIYISNEKKEITHRFAICNAFVHVHEKIKILNRILNKRFQRDNYITPRHYLDYINQFMALFTEKREQLEEQQRHINAGLERLHETVATVNELREKLAHKRLELEEKNDQANRKLSVMVAEQQEAEQQKQLCVDTEKILMQQKKVIDERKEMVMKDLARAEPAVQEAKMNVSNIKKQHLTELRAMGNPPDAVKLTMESVCIMLGHEVDSWKAVQSILRRDDFITSIVNYDTDKMMTKSMRTRISSEYMSQETFNFENVNRASKACGPLVSWIIAQVNYREILDKVGPLRNEVAQLESKADSTKTKVAEMRGKISDLEASIAKIKEEYAVLISQTQEIKQEMEKVKSKVDRSVTLLNSLSSERDRWEQTSKSFTAQLDSLAGDALISSAFLAYSGYFDQKHRAEMISSWTEFLADSNIHIRDSRFFSVLDYLASAEDRETWRSSGLASDVLSLENAAILKRFKRFPLIIDPTGQAVDFLSAMTSGSNKSGHLITTSFLDDSFVKHLESAIRFGNSILIQDVESFDPIINPILNRELKRVGGRVLITIGKQDVDVSPSFKLYLSTRDPVSRFSPDVCSRVTLINFTMTKSSLATQCLTRVLKFERPDIEEKRETIFKLQGEFQVRLRTLEKALLEALSESKGNILDDDNVISSMEKLKADVNDIEKRSIETENSMTQIEEVTKVYQYFAEASSSIFSSIEQLAFLNHYYQFSLDTFQKQIFDPVLSLNALKGISDPFKRLQILWQNLFIETYKRVSMSLMHKDHLVFSLNLCRIKLVADQSGSAVNHNEAFEYLLSPDLEAIAARKSDDLEKASSLVKGALFKSFETGFVREAIVKLKSDLHANQDLVYFEHLGLKSGDESDSIVHLRGLCLVKIACPEMLVLFLGKFIARNLGISPNDSSCSSLESAFGSGTDGLNGLYLIASPSGYDISNKVESLARSKDISLMTIAMGSLESIGLAENAISSAFQRNNGWILLKNIHLASEWLQSLEKKIFSVVKGGSKELKFRLFMTCDVGCLKVPTNLIRLSQVLVMEPPPGLKAALLSSFTSIPEKVLRKDPMERVKVFFVISWIHAILTERLRYPTLGWSKSYEINDCDFDSAVGIVDYWIDSVLSQHETRSNIPPEKIPWYAVKNLLLSYVYGSKMDNDFDAAVLSSFIDHLLGPKVFSGSFKLVPATSELTLGLAIPESNSVEKLKSWILESIPDLNPPSWLGLPNAAEKMVVLEEGKSIFAKIRRVFPDDDVKSDKISDYQKGQDYNDNNNGNNNDNNFKNDNNNDNNYNNDNVNVNDLTFSTSSQWASKIKATANHWLHQFSSLEKFEANKMNSKSSSVEMSSLERYFRRERLEANRLLAIVIGDLRLTMDVLEGREKSSNHSRDLVKCINLGIIPERWKSFYKCLSSFTIFQWMQDFKDRYAHLSSLGPLSEMSELAAKSVWLGGLFSPEGFLTATRQMYAKSLGVSIEMLALDAFIANSESDIAAKKINASHDYFSICDLELINAKVVPSLGILETCSNLSNAVPFMVLQWRQRDPLEIHASSKDLLSSTSEAKKIKIPLYLNSERENLLFSVDLQINNGDQSYLFYQRAVAFTATKG